MKNLEIFSSQSLDVIVTDCSSCAAFLKKYAKVFEDDKRREDLNLPEMNSEELMAHLIKSYSKLGLKILSKKYIPAGGKVDVASTWAGKLTRRSKRPTLYIEAEK